MHPRETTRNREGILQTQEHHPATPHPRDTGVRKKGEGKNSGEGARETPLPRNACVRERQTAMPISGRYEKARGLPEEERAELLANHTKLMSLGMYSFLGASRLIRKWTCVVSASVVSFVRSPSGVLLAVFGFDLWKKGKSPGVPSRWVRLLLESRMSRNRAVDCLLARDSLYKLIVIYL